MFNPNYNPEFEFNSNNFDSNSLPFNDPNDLYEYDNDILPSHHPDNRKIYLSGIPKNADVEAIRTIFHSFIGEVDEVNIIE